MASFPEGWSIIGSAAMVLHGVDAGAVGDVDLLVEPWLADAVFDQMGVTPLTLPPDPLFRSAAFARWDKPPVPVEVMAGLHVAVAGQWQPVALSTRKRIDIAGQRLFVPESSELLALFRLFGRPKDAPRIRALAAAEAAVRPTASA
ncbi:hypothetical protein SOM26_10640 [Sphingomonas sp. CFBP8993]|uniref:hypothetical protein n=1 Tax=Sphingomonas sp. CFBP8993 TaxID=3096526 RepID=UPI002A6A8EBD|nr:hypothetical protein [Sphingomonas sp. CFBP8993]MDY0959139.1 hypothetical protein [Sphingomonas sp. CFBP8993]